LKQSLGPHNGPGVDSAFNRNEYQEYFLGVKAADNLTTFLKSGNPNLMETSGLVQACTGIALLCLSSFYRCELYSYTVSWQVHKAQCGQRQHCWVNLLFTTCWTVMKSCLATKWQTCACESSLNLFHTFYNVKTCALWHIY